MLNALRAETFKAYQNRWLVGFTIYLFPLGAFAGLALLAVILLAGGNVPMDGVLWTEQVVMTLLLPNNFIGQILFLAFTATLFAGESAWNTWKAILPRNRRAWILLSKFIVVALSVFLAMNLMALVTFFGVFALSLLAGEPFQPTIFSAETASFLGDYLATLVSVFGTMMIAATYAALAALITRSVVGGTIAGAILTILDSLSLPILMLMEVITGTEGFVQAYRVMPSFHTSNLHSWIELGTGMAPEGLTAPAAWVSVLALLTWIGAGVALSLWWFQRRDVP